MRQLIIFILVLLTFSSCQKNESFDLTNQEIKNLENFTPENSAQLRDDDLSIDTPEPLKGTCNCKLTYVGPDLLGPITIFASNGTPVNDPNYTSEYNFSITIGGITGGDWDITILQGVDWFIGIRETPDIPNDILYRLFLRCPEDTENRVIELAPNLNPPFDLDYSVQRSLCNRCNCKIKVESISTSDVELDIRSNSSVAPSIILHENFPPTTLPFQATFSWPSGFEHDINFEVIGSGASTPETEICYKLKCVHGRTNVQRFFDGVPTYNVLVNEDNNYEVGVHTYKSEFKDCAATRQDKIETPACL